VNDSEKGHVPFFVGEIEDEEFPRRLERTAQYVAQVALAEANASGCLICKLNRWRGRMRLLATSGVEAAVGCQCEGELDPGVDAALRGEWGSWYDSGGSNGKIRCLPNATWADGSRLVLPLVVESEPIGVIQLFTATRRGFAAAEVSRLRTQADLAAVALENARLYDRGQGLFEIARTVSSTLDTRHVGDLIAKTVARVMSAKGCTARSVNRQTRQLELVGAYGLSRKYLVEKGPVLADKSITAALEGKITVIDHVESDDQLQYPKAALEEGIRSLASVPMVVKGVVTGVLRVHTGVPYHFTPDDLAFLTLAAEIAGAALENARLYDGIRHDFDVLMDEIAFRHRAERATSNDKNAF
jgi:GAF domain-containing protein